jgi:hypothetical protein
VAGGQAAPAPVPITRPLTFGVRGRKTKPIKIVLNEKVAAYILGSICLILAIGMVSGWQRDGNLRGKLKESGKKAEASVTAAHTRFISTGRTSRMEEYVLSVIYMADLKMVSKDFRVTEKGYFDHPQGSKAEVLYDPDDPEKSVLTGDFGLDSAGSAWIGGAFFAVLAVGLFWYAIRRKRPAPVTA